MWLDRAQMLLAALGIVLGAGMVVFGVIAASWPGVLLIIVGVVIFGNGLWFVLDAIRRMGRA
jgi:protein-S-isoprenylcysteine O-methyltransferase Ste14